MQAELAGLVPGWGIALAAGMTVAALAKVLIVWIALRGVPSDKKAPVIRALATLFKADLQLGPFRRSPPADTDPPNEDEPGEG
ncbi:hypothetical protein [Lentzea flava]|uniref:Uncharacterized protein n=1 Tax=Lentzea flava TaxID=103732 RepID=A0ABQ2UBH0_9PSEU|nr:hypothetical protein [Lentzea flava]MCP2197391.1 hypothetical protein [Lentzea flava]GGU19383.1 hypothetical protein GCM10010178_09140 [Lentzea flava]